MKHCGVNILHRNAFFLEHTSTGHLKNNGCYNRESCVLLISPRSLINLFPAPQHCNALRH